MFHNILIILSLLIGYLTFGAVIAGLYCRFNVSYMDDDLRAFFVAIWPIVVLVSIVLAVVYIPVKLVNFIEEFKWPSND